jgi:hypothetical protein
MVGARAGLQNPPSSAFFSNLLDVAYRVCSHVNERFGRPSADHEHDAVMTDDAVYAKWQKQLQQEEDAYNDRLEQERQRRAALGITDTIGEEEVPF